MAREKVNKHQSKIDSLKNQEDDEGDELVKEVKTVKVKVEDKDMSKEELSQIQKDLNDAQAQADKYADEKIVKQSSAEKNIESIDNQQTSTDNMVTAESLANQ